MKNISDTNNMLIVLCLEDVLKDAELINEMLADAGYQVSMDVAAGKESYISCLKSRNYDIILADYTLPGFNAPMALKLAKELQPVVPFICVTGTIGEEKAVELLKQGATDYVLKDRPDRLVFAIRQALVGVEQRKKQHQAEAKTQKLMHELKAHQIELKLQNQALIVSQEQEAITTKKYIELYDFAPSGYVTLTSQGEIIELNHIGAEILGAERSLLKSSSFAFFVTIETKSIFTQFLEKAFRSNILETCELNLLANANPPKYVSLTGIVSGIGEHCMVTMVDITERKIGEQELRKLLRAVEQSPDSIFITNICGEIEYANPAILHLSGYEHHELMGKNPRIFSSGEKTKEEYADLWNTIVSGQVWQGEFHNKKKNGELYWESASISPLTDTSGNITHFLAIREDVTEKKKLIIDLVLAKEHAEESDRLKSAFLANMSHEVRTPLNSIIGFSELLADPAFKEDQKKEFLQHIIISGNNLLNIISDIMDISKMESGEFKIIINQINTQKFISGVKEQFANQIETKKIELKLTLPATNVLTFIMADPDRLSQIFNNLISNAIKFTPNGSIDIGYQPHDQMVKFYVRDTGIGIPANYHAKIFDRFRQVEDATSRKYGGNGLGLAITKNLVELMGGKIWVESEPGHGSTFYFTLPGRAESVHKLTA